MESEYVTITIRVFAAMFAGGLIGFERTFHGRAAGFRTHILVCTASAILIILSIYHHQLGMGGTVDSVRFDPMRIAQGIMTGIGFLGAGVILKEGANIRGLTTAASIWITAAIGIVLGAGFFYPAALAASITLITLIVFRWLEAVLPTHHFVDLTVRFPRSVGFNEEDLNKVIKEQGARATSSGYKLEEDGETLVCKMVVHMRQMGHFRKLAEALKDLESVQDFDLTLTSR